MEAKDEFLITVSFDFLCPKDGWRQDITELGLLFESSGNFHPVFLNAGEGREVPSGTNLI